MILSGKGIEEIKHGAEAAETVPLAAASGE